MFLGRRKKVMKNMRLKLFVDWGRGGKQEMGSGIYVRISLKREETHH